MQLFFPIPSLQLSFVYIIELDLTTFSLEKTNLILYVTCVAGISEKGQVHISEIFSPACDVGLIVTGSYVLESIKKRAFASFYRFHFQSILTQKFTRKGHISFSDHYLSYWAVPGGRIYKAVLNYKYSHANLYHVYVFRIVC